ncbi:unnamed protein product [Rhizoctonia solani]|uniref:Uncharacterized protein n=1 Tax=Rhizoctonia solani TaxID=456999 RepID=A0A8H3HWC5_9AGAM|nr:unnamed protein product [Rhizoctonia solani]
MHPKVPIKGEWLIRFKNRNSIRLVNQPPDLAAGGHQHPLHSGTCEPRDECKNSAGLPAPAKHLPRITREINQLTTTAHQTAHPPHTNPAYIQTPTGRERGPNEYLDFDRPVNQPPPPSALHHGAAQTTLARVDSTEMPAAGDNMDADLRCSYSRPRGTCSWPPPSSSPFPCDPPLHMDSDRPRASRYRRYTPYHPQLRAPDAEIETVVVQTGSEVTGSRSPVTRRLEAVARMLWLQRLIYTVNKRWGRSTPLPRAVDPTSSLAPSPSIQPPVAHSLTLARLSRRPHKAENAAGRVLHRHEGHMDGLRDCTHQQWY